MAMRSTPQQARASAARALATHHADGDEALSLSEAITALHAHADEAQRTRNGRELALFESHPERIGRLVDFLIQGNYRDTASTLAGITARSVRSWMEAAERGDARYEPVADVIKIAECLAEAASVRHVRAAGRDPRFWAADMTYLERRYPDRWARRAEDTSMPRVVVQVGIAAADIKVTLDGGSAESDAILSPPPATPTIK
jgi:hypothetical protein